MRSFRNPKYLERYEDVIFDLEQSLVTADPANNAAQVRAPNLKFIADNRGEATPFDWYNARFSMDFKVNLLAGGNLAVDDHNGIVNGSNSFIKKLTILANGKEVYSCNEANHVANIKNLLEYNSSYARSIGTTEFYYPDTSRSAEERPAQAQYNVGFHLRKKVLGTSVLVNCEIPLNRYSFFEALEDKLLPNTKIEINFEIESDANLAFQAAADCRVIVKRLQLYIPKLTFNAEGQKLYIENYLKPYKWTYLNEVVHTSNNLQQQTGHYRITTAISKPLHVFVWAINTARINAQAQNPFIYDTFGNLPNNANVSRCYLEVGNGNEYPDYHYKPSTDLTRVFRGLLEYVHANNDFQGGTILDMASYKKVYPIIYFDLTKQKMDIKDGVTKLAFHFELSANPNADYNFYALVLHEREAEIKQEDGKLLLRA